MLAGWQLINKLGGEIKKKEETFYERHPDIEKD
jgi:hypothetical protein